MLVAVYQGEEEELEAGNWTPGEVISNSFFFLMCMSVACMDVCHMCALRGQEKVSDILPCEFWE